MKGVNVDNRHSPDSSQAVVIILAVPVVLILSFLALFALNVLARMVVRGEEGVPVGALRWGLAVGLVVAYLLVARTRLPDLAKAIVLAAAVGVVTASLLVTLWDRPALGYALAGVLAVLVGGLIVRQRLPWTYLLAAGEAFVLALFYGLPGA